MIGFVPFEYQRIGVDNTEIGFWFVLIPCGYTLGNLITKKFCSPYWNREDVADWWLDFDHSNQCIAAAKLFRLVPSCFDCDSLSSYLVSHQVL